MDFISVMLHQVITTALLLGWYAAQAYVLGACFYVLSSAVIFLLFFTRIKSLFCGSAQALPRAARTSFPLLIPAAQAAAPGQRPPTWAEVGALQEAGWDIQGHSCTHRPHAALPVAQLKIELEASRQTIVNQINSRVKFYAFPYGNYSRQVLRALQDVGYWASFAVQSGQICPTSDLRRLLRIEINADCSSSVFAKLVRTGYASTPGKYRARLRDALFYFPLVQGRHAKSVWGLRKLAFG